MKTIIKIVLVLFPLFSFSQNYNEVISGDELNKALGIESNDRATIQMENVSNLPSDTILFITTDEKVSFRFDSNLVTTTLKDQMKRFRIYNIYDEDEDNVHKWTTYECKDNSGSIMYFTIGIKKETNQDLFVMDYGSFKFEFDVNRHEIPEETIDILDTLTEDSYFGDGKFGSEYTDEQVKEFLSLFGDSAI